MVHFSVLAFLMSLFIRTHHQTNLVHTSQTYMICQHYSDFIWRWCFLPSAHILCLYFVFLGVKQSYLLTMSFHNIFIINAVPSCCSCCEDGVTDFSSVKVGTHTRPPSPPHFPSGCSFISSDCDEGYDQGEHCHLDIHSIPVLPQ